MRRGLQAGPDAELPLVVLLNLVRLYRQLVLFGQQRRAQALLGPLLIFLMVELVEALLDIARCEGAGVTRWPRNRVEPEKESVEPQKMQSPRMFCEPAFVETFGLEMSPVFVMASAISSACRC
jgi:hypothetical protein